jgi:hypothetical protein
VGLTPVSVTNNYRLLLELKTAAVCMIQQGTPYQTVIPQLYKFLNEEGIGYPPSNSQAAYRMWQQAINRATIARCNYLINPEGSTI